MWNANTRKHVKENAKTHDSLHKKERYLIQKQKMWNQFNLAFLLFHVFALLNDRTKTEKRENGCIQLQQIWQKCQKHFTGHNVWPGKWTCFWEFSSNVKLDLESKEKLCFKSTTRSDKPCSKIALLYRKYCLHLQCFQM